MADDTPQLPSEEELSQLPPKAIVAYAVRAALRVQPLCAKALLDDEKKRRSLIEAVDRALRLASSFSVGKNVASSELGAAYADAAAADADAAAYAAAYAAYAAYAYAYADADGDDDDAVGAARAARAAVDAVDDKSRLIAECRRDFEHLIARLKEKPAAMKRGVSTSERGFLGKLWHGDPPDWYTELKPQLDAILQGKDVPDSNQSAAIRKELA